VLQITQFAIDAGISFKAWSAVLATEGWLDEEAPGSDLRGMRGVFLVGTAFCFMAVRNFQVRCLCAVKHAHARGGWSAMCMQATKELIEQCCSSGFRWHGLDGTAFEQLCSLLG
jgi:hypothetical protein